MKNRIGTMVAAVGAVALLATAVARGDTATNATSKAPQLVIRGVFSFEKADQPPGNPRVWVFYPDGLIIEYGFYDRSTVMLADGTYRLIRRIDENTFELTFDTDNEASARGTGTMKVLTDAKGNKTGFSFHVNECDYHFLGSKTAELQQLLNNVSGKIDWRENKEAEWKVIPSIYTNVAIYIEGK